MWHQDPEIRHESDYQHAHEKNVMNQSTGTSVGIACSESSLVPSCEIVYALVPKCKHIFSEVSIPLHVPMNPPDFLRAWSALSKASHVQC